MPVGSRLETIASCFGAGTPPATVRQRGDGLNPIFWGFETVPCHPNASYNRRVNAPSLFRGSVGGDILKQGSRAELPVTAHDTVPLLVLCLPAEQQSLRPSLNSR